MTQYHEGQDVEGVLEVMAFKAAVAQGEDRFALRNSRIGLPRDKLNEKFFAEVQFPDGSRAVFDERHIRALAQTVRGERALGWTKTGKPTWNKRSVCK